MKAVLTVMLDLATIFSNPVWCKDYVNAVTGGSESTNQINFALVDLYSFCYWFTVASSQRREFSNWCMSKFKGWCDRGTEKSKRSRSLITATASSS